MYDTKDWKARDKIKMITYTVVVTLRLKAMSSPVIAAFMSKKSLDRMMAWQMPAPRREMVAA